MQPKIELFGLKDIPLIKPGDNIPHMIIKSLSADNRALKNGDIIVIAQSIISKSLDRIVDLREVIPSQKALEIFNQMSPKSEKHEVPVKPPELIQVILNESRDILETEHVLIVETKHGFVCANAGIDKSNVEGDSKVSLLPENPDEQANVLKNSIKNLTGKDIAVIISDSFGRPFRVGAVGVGIGVAGIDPIIDKRGSKDLYGNILKSTIVGQVDNLAAAAQLIMGEADEGLPIVLIRGYKFNYFEESSINKILRKEDDDLLRRKFKQKSAIEVIKSRRSYKSEFSNKKIDKEIIKECIEIAIWSPSAHNKQPWHYVILEKNELRTKLIDTMNTKLRKDLLNDGKSEDFVNNKIKQTRYSFKNAPYLILLCLNEKEIDKYPDQDRNNSEYLMGVQSVSVSAMSFLLALEAKRLAACWYCAPLFASEIVIQTLNLPDFYKPMAFITVGYPLEPPTAPKRKVLEQIITEL